MSGSNLNAPFSALVWVSELWAIIPLFSQHPWLACTYTPMSVEQVSISISRAMSFVNCSWSVPRLAHHCAILEYLLNPINLWAASRPMYATPDTGWWWWLQMLLISLLTTSIPSNRSWPSLGKLVISGFLSYLPASNSLKYIDANLPAVSLLLGSFSRSIKSISSTFSKAAVASAIRHFLSSLETY